MLNSNFDALTAETKYEPDAFVLLASGNGDDCPAHGPRSLDFYLVRRQPQTQMANMPLEMCFSQVIQVQLILAC